MRTVLAVYDDVQSARAAIRDLQNSGIDRSDIGFAVKDTDEEFNRYYGHEDNGHNDSSDAGEAAGVSAVVGTVAGLTTALIPGIGPVVAIGPFAAALVSGIGAAAGAATGGIIGSLTDLGFNEDEAHTYAEAVRRGGALVTVTTGEGRDNRVRNIMNNHDPVDMDTRSAQWRKSGWDRFDPDEDEFTAEEIARDRETYRTSVDKDRAGVDRTRLAGSSSYYGYEPAFRRHYYDTYGVYDNDWVYYAPAYTYGYNIAADPIYQGRTWTDIEPEARRNWNQNPNRHSAWDDIKDAVQHAWERVTDDNERHAEHSNVNHERYPDRA